MKEKVCPCELWQAKEQQWQQCPSQKLKKFAFMDMLQAGLWGAEIFGTTSKKVIMKIRS